MHGFFKKHFRMSFYSFQALCRILSQFMAIRDTRFRAAVHGAGQTADTRLLIWVKHGKRWFLWSSISAKTRSLYSILDLLYFMLPYTMRHPIVLISWFNFSIVHGTFSFSHSISRMWQYHDFRLLLSKGQLCKFRLSKFCFQHPSSCIWLRSTSFRNPLREDIAGADNLHPHPHGNRGKTPSSRVE